MTSNYPKTPHVAQALVMAETLRELYPRGVPRQAANLLRKQHAEIERLRADAERYRWMKLVVKRIPPAWELMGWDAAIDAAMKEDKR